MATVVGVIGAGLMGSGIAEVCARSGHTVRLTEADQTRLDGGLTRIRSSLKRGVDGGKLTQEAADEIFGRVAPTTSLNDFSDCDVVIEAVVENIELKRDLFARLDAIAPAHALLASNTSSLPLIDIAAATKRPERVVGLHFFNPAPVMKLLEIVRSIATSDDALAEARRFGEGLGKEVVVAKDRGGFIVNLLLVPYLTNAVRMLEAGHATKEDIDTGMKLGCGHPMGPLELLDYIGLDTTLFVCNALYTEYGSPDYAAPVLLKRMVSAGHLGKKSGKGFYDYATVAPRERVPAHA